MPTSFGIVSPSCLPGPSPSQEPAAYLASVVDEFLAAEGSGEEVSVKQVSLSSLARISPLPALDADSRPTSKRRLNPAISFENRTRNHHRRETFSPADGGCPPGKNLFQRLMPQSLGGTEEAWEPNNIQK